MPKSLAAIDPAIRFYNFLIGLHQFIFGCTAFIQFLEQFSASWLTPEEVWMVEIELFHTFPEPTGPRRQNRMGPFTNLKSAFDSIYFKPSGPERRLKHSRNSLT